MRVTFEKVESEEISYIDFALIKHLLKNDRSEEAEQFLLQMIKTVREGNLWLESTEKCPLPKHLVSLVKRGDEIPKTAVCQYENRYYFQKYWKLDEQFHQLFHHLCKSQPKIAVEPPDLSNLPLLDEQKQAVRNGFDNCVSVITGGPGTGKTYTVRWLVEMLCRSLSEAELNNFKIVLTAPTGKAATHLKATLTSNFSIIDIEAKTLHALLHLSTWKLKYDNDPLPYDLIIVDESSMIDSKLMVLLLQAVDLGSRLIFLGDPYQLPPVESGGFFRELIHLIPKKQKVFLDKCQRTEHLDMQLFAKAISEGSLEQAHSLINSSDSIELTRFEESPKIIQRKCVEWILQHFPKPLFEDEKSLNEYLESIQKYRLLSPLRQGMLGVNALNQLILEEYQRLYQGEELMIPILITANDYKLDLFNGDIGLLHGENAYVSGRKISSHLLPNYEPAWALSVHKSQGSEYDNVLLLLPETSDRFGRSLLYTGVTRAKKSLTIWSSIDLFDKILSM